MGGSAEEIHLSYWQGQQKFRLLSEAEGERMRGTHRPSQPRHHVLPISCVEILQQNIAPFQPPFAKMDHGNLRQVPSPAREQERRGGCAGTESSGSCIWGWGLL